jgi:hypothetical protein
MAGTKETAMAENIQRGTQQGVPQRTRDDIDFKANVEDAEKEDRAETSDVEAGIGNDSGTIPGRKVDHSNPHDIPPPGMKRKY